MKPMFFLIVILLLSHISFSQTPNVSLTTDKTTCLVFPFTIRHVDRGTKDILAQQVKEAGNILLIKAASANFPQTNLSVVTEDGSLYCFVVNYEPSPQTWVYRLSIQSKATVAMYANNILDNPRTIYGIRNTSWRVQADVTGIYIKDETIYYQLELTNNSSLDYDIDYLRFYIRYKKKVKRTSLQEIELQPQYIAGNPSDVRANSHLTLVVALDKFTLAEKKDLVIEISEKNGGRNLVLKVGNRKIIKAKILPDLK